MKMYGHEFPDDALEWHKCYLINGEELYWLMEIEDTLARKGLRDDSMLMNKIVKSALEHEFEEDDDE